MPRKVKDHQSNSAINGSSNPGTLPGDNLQAFLNDEGQLHLLDDLTKVNPVTPATVLKCLQVRYAAGVFYTTAGCTLVALNPFQHVPHLYSTTLMRLYHCTPLPQELPPHIFTVAEQTYRNIKSLSEPVNQSIIISGESGAGKTWTSRCLMKFYATVAASCVSQGGDATVERIERRVLDSNPIMEAFGNACTLRNNNSSRFGKYIQLHLDRDQQMTGASIQTYLLEKTRVAYQAPCERNFHIFYQIAKGASAEERLEWELPENADFCWLPNSSRTLTEDCFQVTRDAMLHLGIDCPAQNNIFKVLAGLLHLGNVRFSEPEDEAEPCSPRDGARGSVETASVLLQVPREQLLAGLQIRTLTAGKQQHILRKPCSRGECETRRDCLAKVTYARLFDWLVSVINGSICSEPTSWTNFIGLLDVYGFESFPNNSLEQLCINYANEKLQQHFVGHYLKAQQEEYAAEGLEWSFISYQDNQRCLDLIEGSPQQPISICSLLNEECRLMRPSNAAQLQVRIESALSGSPSLGRDRLSQQPGFTVSHYAGPVRYNLDGLVEKNKDPVPPELIQLLQGSQDPLLQMLFPAKEMEQKDPTAPRRATVVSKFKGSLDQLMEILHSTTPHYVRCIKPNSQGQAQTFQTQEVLSQLEACGIVETIHISAAGYPVRVSLQSFIKRYQLLRKPRLPKPEIARRDHGSSAPAGHPGGCLASDAELRSLVTGVLQALPLEQMTTAPPPQSGGGPGPVPVHCGKTKVFMTDFVLELLEQRRARALAECAHCIQCCWRRHRARKRGKQKRAATLIQAAVRSWLTRKQIQRMHRAATIIKQAWRKWKVKMDFLVAKELDAVEGQPLTTGFQAPISSTPPANSTWPLNTIIRLWPLGLVLFNAPVSCRGGRRDFCLRACLYLPQRDSRSRAKVEVAQCDRAGIASVRAHPQGSVRFHCKKSPLLYANISPDRQTGDVTGFNQILLEKHKLIEV
ncbi:unconventional myosin-XIX isoform X1 [Ornithorhynchus anatinus]|uniref:unconventional myosin-XIX isoform X1 n=1 Tax=Ornithorhynchus anatinus TaxID=9258 RepID=UPI0010A901AC|nr:unconventional myosin-XIX isoform X1 [Ornithorhynchus anatinus]